MVEALTDADARVDDPIDADSNQGIGYARDDVDGDSMMWMTLLNIIIVIMAFVFVVLTDATIEEESAIIGTLLASGYRRREIVLHYLALPAIVGVLAALLGTALGVAFFTEPMRGLYYGSYSLPPFQVYWSWEIFVKCAVVPAAALILITLVGLLRKMGKTPLQFLRHEASGKSGTKRGLQLPERMGFVSRFRLRIFLRNLGNFAMLFVGIAFASLLMLFWPGDPAHDDALCGQPRDKPGRRTPVHAQGAAGARGHCRGARAVVGTRAPAVGGRCAPHRRPRCR